MDLLIEGKALLEGGLAECCIGVEEGKIAKIAKTMGRADKRLDFSGKIIMPAGIDLHVHFRDPGMTSKEDFGTGSAAAACGGVSFVMDMPNTKPATRTLSDLKEKISIASKKSHVDFGIAALLDGKTDVDKVAPLASAMKIYLGETTGGLGIAPEELGGCISRAGEKQVFVHAEHVRRLGEAVEKNLQDHDLRRSENLELEAVEKVISARTEKSRIHLLHVTQTKILGLARSSGLTTEVTPHHLLLNGFKAKNLGTQGKINPPLRSIDTQLHLWDSFISGEATTLGSDHSPHTLAEKDVEFDAAPSGMPGVETLMPLMLQKVAERKLDISLLSKYCSLNPARIIGLKKGKIEVGYDADIIAFDIRGERVRSYIRADRLHSKCGWTPYEGMEAVFPAMTMIRGEEVARDGELTGGRIGRHVAPGGGGSND